MDSSTQNVSPLRLRMIDDMRIRKLSAKTQAAYTRGVRQFTRYLRRSPDSATIEDLRPSSRSSDCEWHEAKHLPGRACAISRRVAADRLSAPPKLEGQALDFPGRGKVTIGNVPALERLGREAQ